MNYYFFYTHVWRNRLFYTENNGVDLVSLNGSRLFEWGACENFLFCPFSHADTVHPAYTRQFWRVNMPKFSAPLICSFLYWKKIRSVLLVKSYKRYFFIFKSDKNSDLWKSFSLAENSTEAEHIWRKKSFSRERERVFPQTIWQSRSRTYWVRTFLSYIIAEMPLINYV